MGLDLVEAVKGQLSPALLGRVGGAFGMSPDTAAKVTQGALPTVVSGITSIAGTEPGASKLMAMLPRDGRQADGEPLIAPLDDIKDVSNFGEGALGTLFGDRLHHDSTEPAGFRPRIATAARHAPVARQLHRHPTRHAPVPRGEPGVPRTWSGGPHGRSGITGLCHARVMNERAEAHTGRGPER